MNGKLKNIYVYIYARGHQENMLHVNVMRIGLVVAHPSFIVVVE